MFDFDTKYIGGHYNVMGSKNASKQMYVSHTFKVCTVLEGEAVWKIGETAYEIHKNDMVLLNNRDRRMFIKIHEGTVVKLFSVEFEPYVLFSTEFLPLFMNKIKGFNPVIPGHETMEMLPLVRTIETEFVHKKADYHDVVSLSLYTLLFFIKRYYDANGFETKKQYFNSNIYKAIDYINEHFDKEISLDQVAGVMHMSASAFSKYFLKVNGIGFHQYVTRKRIEKAVYLLETTDDTVLSIAMECGFNNGASFYQAFQRTVGGTPASYRQ